MTVHPAGKALKMVLDSASTNLLNDDLLMSLIKQSVA